MPLALTSPVTVFAGKGGVGKTTCAAAAALHSASGGSKTLVISTDATPSLAHIFNTPPDNEPKQAGKNLYFQEIGIEQARQMWDRRFGRDVYQVFSSFVDLGYNEFTNFMASMLPGLAEEFLVDYIRELCQNKQYDRVIWDTAPLGQTLALLETPSMLSRHLRMAPRIYTKLKAGSSTGEPILDIIKRWEALSTLDIKFLREEVKFNIVAIAEALAVNQLDGILAELDKHSFKVNSLIINNLVKADGSAFLKEKSMQQKGYMDLIHKKYGRLNITALPMLPHEIRGIDSIREMSSSIFGGLD